MTTRRSSTSPPLQYPADPYCGVLLNAYNHCRQVGMAGGGKDANASQFYITTGTDLDSLDEKYTVFGEV